MAQRLFKEIKGNKSFWNPENSLDNDFKLNACQHECAARLSTAIHLDSVAYLLRHPEIKAMMKTCLATTKVLKSDKNSAIKEVALYFSKPADQLDNDIRKALKVHRGEPYVASNIKSPVTLEDKYVVEDIIKIIQKHYPDALKKVPSSEVSLPATVSSSFISIMTSEMTVPTPEPTPIPTPTTSDIFYQLILTTMDKATLVGVTDEDILYDTAYVELKKVVEAAMEIPVTEIRADIGALLDLAYRIFEYYVEDKEKQAAALAWERRMRKKLKRTLRRQMNFKGYETPPTPKSEVSSHSSYKVAPPRPCKCHPQWSYNRYPKDRFGIYLPRETTLEINNLTTTPVVSVENLTLLSDDTTSKQS